MCKQKGEAKHLLALHTHQVRPSQRSGPKETVISCPDTTLFKISTADSCPSKDNCPGNAKVQQDEVYAGSQGVLSAFLNWLAVADEAEVRDQ